ncbi:hypothetical protein M0R45_002080 [Rubus argutus]|uniref:Uncharacterized protein n=1 Tax=Rubus argutus TaxID=59490 RepID=A0AAW1VKJ3_RUBAR
MAPLSSITCPPLGLINFFLIKRPALSQLHHWFVCQFIEHPRTPAVAWISLLPFLLGILHMSTLGLSNFILIRQPALSQLHIIVRLTKHFLLSEANRALFCSEANRTLFHSEANQVFFRSEANRVLFLSEANRTLFHSEANQVLFHSEANRALFLSEANRTLFLSEANQVLFRSEANGTILLSEANQTLFRSEANQTLFPDRDTLITTSTQTRQLVPSSFVYVELDFEPPLALPFKNGALVISLVKKHKGRLVGSKNKSKVENVQPKKIKVFFNGSKLRNKWSPRVMNNKITDIVSIGIPGNTPFV